MNEAQLAAADALWAFYAAQTADQTAGQAPADELAPAFGSLGLDDGLAVQCELFRRRQADGARLAGYKVGLTSERARKAVGSDERPFGHITKVVASRSELGVVADTGVAGQLGIGGALSVEPEMCFVLGDELAGPDLTASDVRAAVREVRAGYEINESRVALRGGLALLVADNLTNYAIVEGDVASAVLDAGDLDDTVVTVRCNGEERFCDRAGNHVDAPYASIAALAATLHRHGLSLLPDQRVITGAYARFDVSAGETWTTTYDTLGTVEVSFR